MGLKAIVPVVTVLAGLAVVSRAAPPEAVDLGDYVVQGSVSFAADLAGNMACWERDRGVVRSWDRHGESRGVCRLDDARLPLEPNILAYNDGKALLTFFDFEAGSETLRRGVIVDVDRCRVEATLSVPGVVHEIVPAKTGWFALSREPFEPGSQFIRLDEDGSVSDAITLNEEFEGVTARRGFGRNPLNYLGRPAVIGKDLWIVPHGDYELWFPPQHGRSFHRLEPPSCLVAHGRQLSGEENAAHLLARAESFPERYRAPLEAAARTGARAPTVVSATAGLIAFDHMLAVKVMDDRLASGARVDVWDMYSESVVAVLPFGAQERLLAAGDGEMWIIENGRRVRSVPLPDLAQPAGDACRALHTAIAEAQRAEEVSRVASAFSR